MTIRTKLRDRKLPNYTRGEELFNMISHISGGVFAIAALLVCLIVGAWHRNVWAVASGAVYGATMILLYTMSSIYHGLVPEMPKKIFQIIDHCAIFFLIAGTYTPIALVRLRLEQPKIAWGLFAFIWGMCVIGVVFNAIDLKKFLPFSMVCYVGLGWSVVIFSKQLLAAIPVSSYVWLLSGGISYTVGSVLYLIGKKKKYMHSVFHLFVVLGSVLHFISVLICFTYS